MIDMYKQYISFKDNLSIYEFKIVLEIYEEKGKDIRFLIDQYKEHKDTVYYRLYGMNLKERFYK